MRLSPIEARFFRVEEDHGLAARIVVECERTLHCAPIPTGRKGTKTQWVARQMSCWLIREQTDLTWEQISRYVGLSDSSAAYHAAEMFKVKMITYWLALERVTYNLDLNEKTEWIDSR